MSKTKTLRKQHYRPASEFDEKTLASKREYWRTKKREQRAKLSAGNKKSKTTKAGVCKPICTVSVKDEPVLRVPQSECGRVSFTNDGSCQTDATQNHTKSTVICKEEQHRLSSEESNMGGSMVKHNEAPLSKGRPAPKAHIKLNSKSTDARKISIRSSAFNSSLSCISPRSAVSQFTTQVNTQKNPQMKCSPPLRSLAFTEYKVVKDQLNLKRRGANTSGKSCAYVSKCSQAQCKATDITMTEEEIVAKRRENWRIKKREQRAKRAQKLKMERERMQFIEKGPRNTGTSSSLAPRQALSSANTMVLRGAKQHTSVTADLRKSVNCGIEVQRYNLPRRQTPHRQQTVALKVGSNPRSPARNFSSVSVRASNQLQNMRNNMSISSRVSVQPITVNQFTQQSKMYQQKFVQIQRRQPLPQGNNRLETADERLAKQREYWRIKKHSTVSRARLKERDAFNWRTKCYQSIMEQIRKTPAGFKKVVPPNKNMLLNTFKTNSGFIKDDGTVSFPILETTAVKPSSALHGSFPAVTSPYLAGPISQPYKRVSVRARAAPHGICSNINSSVNIHQRSPGQSISAVDPLVKPTRGSSTVDGEVVRNLGKTTQAKELAKNDWTTCNRKVKSCDSSKQEHIYPSIDSVYSLAEQSQSTDVKGIKSRPPSPAASKSESEPSNGDSQSTTLLVVASMKRLLEESLSSVFDDNSCPVVEDGLQTRGTEDKPEEKEKYTKPDLATQFEVVECDLSEDTYPSVEVKQSSSPCHFSQTEGSADGTLSSCQDSSLKLPCTVTADSSRFNQGSGTTLHDVPAAVSVNNLYRSEPEHSGKTAVPQQYCPSNTRGGQQVNESSELQKKREYWRVMKRQQRARKAKEKEGSKGAVQPSQRVQRRCPSFQALHPPVAKSRTNPNNHFIQPTVTSRPTRVVLSPTTSTNYQPPVEGRQLMYDGAQCEYKSSEMYRVNRPQPQRSAQIPSTKPGAVTVTQVKNVKLPDALTQTSGPSTTKLRNNRSHLKETANEDAEETIRRRRMLWRIKKQEQRARKAAREKELRHQRTVSHMENNWSSNNGELVQSCSNTVPERHSYIPEQSQTEPLKDADVCLLPDDYSAYESVSDVEWRNTYLMDYDAVNQLLVCMVCAEQQYTFSVEAVRAHIEETHPGTLNLEEAERQRILRDWDELVAVRERFFTNQLWQNSDALKGESSKHLPEVEVILDPDDKTDTS